MAAQRSSLKRKLFSDCTNTITTRADAVRRKTLRSVLEQPLKSSQENDYENPIGSLKSNTSTGSNNPPISESARSTLLPASYDSENQEAKKRKDKANRLAEDDAVVQPDFQDKVKAVVEDTLVIQTDHQETGKRKDKRKEVVEDIVTFQPDHQETGKRKEKGKEVVEDTEVSLLDYRETRKWKDKGKAVVEDIESILPYYRDTRKWKDKGKVVAEDTEVILPDYGESRNWKDKGKAVAEDILLVVPDSDDDEIRKRKDKGKAIREDTTVVQPDHQETINKEINKDKRKAVIEDSNIFEPPSATVSGSYHDGLFKFRTVYSRKRAPEARNIRPLKITEPFSCPPPKRLNVKGKQVDGGRDDKSVIRRKSFPAPKKKSRGKSKQEAVDEMPKEEVEKLKAYYADIDAFELDVEEAEGGESD